MSMRLLVEPYCEDCPNFEADVEQTTFYSNLGGCKKCETTIMCVRRSSCACIAEYIESKSKKQKGDL